MKFPTLLAVIVAIVLAGCGTNGSESSSTSLAATSSSTSSSSTSIGSTTSSSTATTSSTTSTSSTTLDDGWVELFVDAEDGITFLEVEDGDQVRIVVSADTTDEVHLHGYDVKANVTPDTDAVLEFEASQPGVFEIELEDAGRRIAELTVNP